MALIGEAGTVPADPADLAGMTIGTPGQFGSSWHALLALLDAGGLTADDITVREYPQFNQVDGLTNGDVDLITGFRNNEPLQLEARGMSVDLLTVDEIAPLPGPGDDRRRRAARRRTRSSCGPSSRPPPRRRPRSSTIPTSGSRPQRSLCRRSPRTPDVARAVLDATVELWEGDGFANGAIDEELWATGYETMQRLGFIDGSVPLEEMIVTDLGGG